MSVVTSNTAVKAQASSNGQAIKKKANKQATDKRTKQQKERNTHEFKRLRGEGLIDLIKDATADKLRH